MNEKSKQVKDVVKKIAASRRKPAEVIEDDEPLSEYMNMVNSKRKRNKDKLKVLGLAPKSPLKQSASKKSPKKQDKTTPKKKSKKVN